jgi:SAM-dependent methyltransferase
MKNCSEFTASSESLPLRRTPLRRLDFDNTLRTEEISGVLARHSNLFLGRDLLEIGSGTGAQLRLLGAVCKSAVGIEIADSGYAAHRLIEIHEYDGRRIPFPSSSFDAVFSSNVIEHIRNEQMIHREIHRVLRPDGVAIHIVPSATCRVWTSIAHYPAQLKIILSKLRRSQTSTEPAKDVAPVERVQWRTRVLNALFLPRHGEFGNRITESWLWRKAGWRRRFEAQGWHVEIIEPVGFAYSAYYLLAGRLSMRARTRWARIIGSSSLLFVLRPK